MSEWQPIETAPMEEDRLVLLGWAGIVGRGCVDSGYWMADPKRNYWGETGWFCSDDDVLTSHPSKPTHWMPLPEPPTDMQGGRE